MKKRGWLIGGVIALSASVGVWAYQGRTAAHDAGYRFVEIERGDVLETVSATGNLSAVTTVSVGTQVSGQVSGIFVDFNDEVKKGQLLARIDPTLAEQSVVEAQSSLDRARAELVDAQREHARNRELLDEGLVAQSTFDSVDSRLTVARANVRSAEVSLQRARQNLSYTEIYAPIDGVVVERNVDVGQTVAASLQAPQLFLIANDLSRMQILAQVDESDIARITKSQPVTFTVQALPRETFRGSVKQVRLQSSMQESVVSYTVVVEVDNSNGRLLPGMTASVEFEVAKSDDVLRVANAALRFRPDPVAVRATSADVTGPRRRDGAMRGGARTRPGRGSAQASRLFLVDENTGELRMLRVETGVSDGSVTEIRGSDVREGMQVVAGSMAAASSASSSPFAQQSSGGRGPRGAF